MPAHGQPRSAWRVSPVSLSAVLHHGGADERVRHSPLQEGSGPLARYQAQRRCQRQSDQRIHPDGVKRPVVIFLSGTALLLVVVLRGVLDPSVDRLPGIDSGNIYAWEVYTRSVLADWKLPFWNPYHFAGTPHLADPQTTVLYPPAMLLRWLPVPAFLGWMLALHLWIAGAGTLFAARAMGVGWIAASAAGVAVMLGGSVSGWIHGGHLLLIYSAAWVPWALGLAIVSVRSGRVVPDGRLVAVLALRSEEHTSELQSQSNLVCRLLLEKKKESRRET